MEADTHWGVKWLFTDPDDSTSYAFNSALLLLDSLNWHNVDKHFLNPPKNLMTVKKIPNSNARDQ